METQEQKVIVVKRGETFWMECMQDEVTGELYFLIRDGEGMAMKASEVQAGKALYTTDEGKMRYAKSSFYFQVYQTIKSLIENGSLEVKTDYGDGVGKEIKYIRVNALQKVINNNLEEEQPVL